MSNRDNPADSSAFVDAGILLCFEASTVTQTRRDVLDSMLLAQLVADKEYPRIDEPRAWFSSYTATLGKLAWNFGSVQFGTYEPAAARFTLAQVLIDVISKYEPWERGLLHETLSAFAALPDDDRRYIVYRDFAVSEHAVTVLAGVGSGANFVVVGLFLRTRQSIERPFDTEFLVESLEDPIATVCCSGFLNESVFAKIRSQVIDKLGSKRDEFILELFDKASPPANERK